jgi:hypothetical protein
VGWWRCPGRVAPGHRGRVSPPMLERLRPGFGPRPAAVTVKDVEHAVFTSAQPAGKGDNCAQVGRDRHRGVILQLIFSIRLVSNLRQRSINGTEGTGLATSNSTFRIEPAGAVGANPALGSARPLGHLAPQGGGACGGAREKMNCRGWRYLPLVLCFVALDGFSTRSCASVLFVSPTKGSLPPGAASLQKRLLGGQPNGSRPCVPYLLKLSGGSAFPLSSAAGGATFVGDDLDELLPFPCWVEEGSGSQPPAGPADGQPGHRAPALLDTGAEASGMAPPAGSSPDPPSAPVAGLVPGDGAVHHPEGVRLPPTHEVILLSYYVSRIFRPPRLPGGGVQYARS